MVYLGLQSSRKSIPLSAKKPDSVIVSIQVLKKTNNFLMISYTFFALNFSFAGFSGYKARAVFFVKECSNKVGVCHF